MAAIVKDKQLGPHATIQEAILCIDSNSAKIVFIIDKKDCLIGSVTDGDIRRGLLKGISLDSAISKIMNITPITAHIGDSPEHILKLIRENEHKYIPIIDTDNRIHKIESETGLLDKDVKENCVFFNGGGIGKRLRPLTEDIPKPLLHVGNKPILENILDSFIESGFKKFIISVHYKAEMVMEYFGSGEEWGIEIQYVQEETPLGTVGALGLLPRIPEQSIIIMNGDILTKVNFDHLLDFHTEHQSIATMCIREYDFQVPYGTVEINGHHAEKIIEKPVHTFFVNAGIYVLEPKAVEYIAKNTNMDMPDLLNELKLKNNQVSVFPIHEYWLDIGHMDDFERAQADYLLQFK